MHCARLISSTVPRLYGYVADQLFHGRTKVKSMYHDTNLERKLYDSPDFSTGNTMYVDFRCWSMDGCYICVAFMYPTNSWTQ